MLVRSASRDYRTWIIDSRRWQNYRPRADDIIIATYPKCGTTWTQRIIGMLVFGSPDPQPIWHISPWVDRRIPEPLDAVMARIDAQTHRRFLKSHLPLDGLPFYNEVKYVHVCRDGRDAAMSFHNHGRSFTKEMLESLSRSGLADEAVARPYPEVPADPADYFHRWLTESAVAGDEDGLPAMSFFHTEQTWWDARKEPNVLLVHYNDLQADLAGEIQRTADFLGINVPDRLLTELVQAACFETMRREGDTLMGAGKAIFQDGSESFFFRGTNQRWRGVFRDHDLALYERKLTAALPAAGAEWVANGWRSSAPDEMKGAHKPLLILH